MDQLLRPLYQWVWSDPDRRVRKLLIFGEVETDGGRDILRASEVTPDPLLRRLYLEHAIDELHHGVLFKERGEALLRQRPARSNTLFGGNPLPGGHGLDASRSTRTALTTTRRRVRSSRKSCAMKSSI